MRNNRIVIGTRGSKLARVQAEIVEHRLRQVRPYAQIEQRIIVTSGDRDRKSDLSVIGGKGVFIRELEQALIDGMIDLAVHSFKDVTTRLAPSLVLDAFLTPESVADILVTDCDMPLAFLPKGALIGTGSTRRKALLQRLRPDLEVTPIRGNVDTRIAKVDRKEYTGVMLSEAGLIRLGLGNRVSIRMDPETFYPAPGQGVITVETRSDDRELREICSQIGDARQLQISSAELALLGTIGFDCRTPLGVYSRVENGTLRMKGFFVDETAGTFRECATEGAAEECVAVGNELALLLLQRETR
ncbi:MAG: hydroxymethylbilane synthase [Chitinispirillaceae bacterium]|nr:hydroxymethylbilane synthase [Chitinispirillaceae bacterium]